MYEPQDMEYRISGDIYISYAGAARMLLHINGKFTIENWINFFCRKVSFLAAPHCQFQGVGQGMGSKKYYIYHGSYELTYLNQRIRRMSWFK